MIVYDLIMPPKSAHTRQRAKDTASGAGPSGPAHLEAGPSTLPPSRSQDIGTEAVEEPETVLDNAMELIRRLTVAYEQAQRDIVSLNERVNAQAEKLAELVEGHGSVPPVEVRLSAQYEEIVTLQRRSQVHAQALRGLNEGTERDRVVYEERHITPGEAIRRIMVRVEDLERKSAQSGAPAPQQPTGVAATGGQSAHNEEHSDAQAEEEHALDELDDIERKEVARDHKSDRRSHRSRRRDSSRRRRHYYTSDEDRGSRSSRSERSNSGSEGDRDDGHTRSAYTRPLLQRRRGSHFHGLKPIRPSDPRYDRLVDYRTYRLQDTAQSRRGRETGKTRDHVKRLELSFKDSTFNGTDPVTVLSFLADVVIECDILEMSEAQAYLALPFLLTGSAKVQFRAARSVGRSTEGGVSCWPEAVQYLLRKYAKSAFIRRANSDLRDVRQRDQETEESYEARLSQAVARCGNVHSTHERITMLIDGLLPTTKSIISDYHESHRWAQYGDIVQKAIGEGEAYRARAQASAPAAPSRLTVPNRRDRERNQLLAESYDGSFSGHGGGEAALQMDVGSSQRSGLTTPTEDYESAQSADPALAMYGRGTRPMRPPQRPPMGLPRPTNRAVQPALDAPAEAHNGGHLVCHYCYAVGHIAPRCTLPMSRSEEVVTNYRALSAAQKERVPRTNYDRFVSRGNPTQDAVQVVEEPQYDAMEPIIGTDEEPKKEQ